MSYQALYRKWRPDTFDEVVGQDHITKTIKNEIVSGRVAHAYLFTGIRGTGKTSTAKIFSRAVNCINNTDGNPCNECEICKGIADGSIMDIVEFDAASNNGVENIREIRDEVVYTASVAKYKVYIIDEVHMLSSGAFNALLKTLEEPPSHVIFILATTEVQKLPQTILSRCQRFDFRTITSTDVANKLKEVADADGITAEYEALLLIANMAEGSMRDAMSILDRVIAYGQNEISYDDVVNILGVADFKLNHNVLQAIINEDAKSAIFSLNEGVASGKSPVQILDGLLRSVRNLLMLKLTGSSNKILEGTKESLEEMTKLAESFTEEKLLNCIKVLSETAGTVKLSANAGIVVELAVIKLCMPIYDSSAESMADRISLLEKKLEEGVVVKTKVAQAPPPEKKAETEEEKPPVTFEFKGKYKDKWADILAVVKKQNPGITAFLSSLKPAGEGDVLLLTASNEKGANAINFLDKEDFKNKIATVVEEVCGSKPRKIQFEKNITEKENKSLAEKLKVYDFVVIHE